MILLDTSVLVYAAGEEHRWQQPSRRLISRIAYGEIAATTTVEAIQEFAHVRARRRPREDAFALASDYATLLAPLVTVDADDLRAGLDLWRHSDGLGSFDAVLAATTLRRAHLRSLVTTDSGFRVVSGLSVTTPDDY